MLRNYVQIDEPTRSRQTKQLILTKRHEDILYAVVKYRGLTAEQVVKLFFKSGSLTYVRVILKELVEHKYLRRILFPHVKPGSSAYIYSLGTRGVTFLSDRDLYLPGYKPVSSKNYNILAHLLMVNEFAIAAELLPRLTADVSLDNWLHEWQVKQRPVSEKIESVTIDSCPDLFLDFHVRAGSQKKPYRMPIVVEIDMGTEWGAKFKNKLRDIALLVTSGAYQQQLGCETITVAFATPGTVKRRDLMRSHMKTVLEELGKVRFADWFLFASLQQELDPLPVFVSTPQWYTPIADKPIPLLDLSD